MVIRTDKCRQLRLGEEKSIPIPTIAIGSGFCDMGGSAPAPSGPEFSIPYRHLDDSMPKILATLVLRWLDVLQNKVVDVKMEKNCVN